MLQLDRKWIGFFKILYNNIVITWELKRSSGLSLKDSLVIILLEDSSADIAGAVVLHVSEEQCGSKRGIFSE